MNWTRNKRLWLLSFAVLLLLVVFVGFYQYRMSLQRDFGESACRTLNEWTEQQRFHLRGRLNADQSALQTLAHTLPYLPDARARQQALSESFGTERRFDRILLVDAQGQGLSRQGAPVNIAKTSYFQAALRGKTVLDRPQPCAPDGQLLFPFATPIYQGTEVVGVLAAYYQPQRLDSLLLTSYGEDSHSILTDAQGHVLYQTGADQPLFSEDNLLDALKTLPFRAYDRVEDLPDKMAAQESGHSIYLLADQSMLMHYTPLDFNGWYLFVSIPESLISERAIGMANSSNLLTFVILVLFSLLGLYSLSLEQSGAEEKRARLADLEQAAYYDPLTALPNLPKFKLEAQQLLQNGTAQQYLLLKFDIRNFKAVNEMFGFQVGNEVICAVADLFPQVRAALGLPPCLLARSNADEFLVLDRIDETSAPSELHAALLSEMIVDRLSPLLGPHRIDFRYGRYRIDSMEEGIGTALEKVNLAHRMAKNKQVNAVCDYDEHFRENVLRDVAIENRMHAALADGEFTVYLQAKYALADETVVGAEALVRWREADGHLMPPGDFIPLFERNGFIIQLDRYVFEQVCMLLQQRQEAGLPIVTVSVNFSRLHLSNRNLVQELLDITTRYQLPTHYIEIELTESIIFDHAEALHQLLYELHAAGFSLSMDDFGSGYSSLGLLKDLPVDVIKMDRTFFGNSMYKTRAKLLIESIMQLAHNLNIHTVAEGVEVEEHIDFLREVGCEIVQGYYYARPLPPEEFFRLLDDPAPRAARAPAELLPLAPNDSIPDLEQLEVTIPLSVYRLFLYTLREATERRYGEEAMHTLLRSCGHMTGYLLANKLLSLSLSPDAFLAQVEHLFRESKIALLQIESVDWDQWILRLAFRDDLGCSGISPGGNPVCQYDEGLLAGVLYAYTHREFQVQELDCWATGAGLCRFDIRPKDLHH